MNDQQQGNGRGRQLAVYALQDGIAAAGAVAIGYGLYQIWAPLMWLWIGAALLAISYSWQNGRSN